LVGDGRTDELQSSRVESAPETRGGTRVRSFSHLAPVAESCVRRWLGKWRRRMSRRREVMADRFARGTGRGVGTNGTLVTEGGRRSAAWGRRRASRLDNSVRVAATGVCPPAPRSIGLAPTPFLSLGKSLSELIRLRIERHPFPHNNTLSQSLRRIHHDTLKGLSMLLRRTDRVKKTKHVDRRMP